MTIMKLVVFAIRELAIIKSICWLGYNVMQVVGEVVSTGKAYRFVMYTVLATQFVISSIC